MAKQNIYQIGSEASKSNSEAKQQFKRDNNKFKRDNNKFKRDNNKFEKKKIIKKAYGNQGKERRQFANKSQGYKGKFDRQNKGKFDRQYNGNFERQNSGKFNRKGTEAIRRLQNHSRGNNDKFGRGNGDKSNRFNRYRSSSGNRQNRGLQFQRNNKRPFDRNNYNNDRRQDYKHKSKNDFNNNQRFEKRQYIKKQQNNKSEIKQRQVNESKFVKRQDRPTKKERDENNPQKQRKDKDGNRKPTIKHNRMIIRNLVFDINEKHIKKLLGSYGKILEVNIPKNPDDKGSRGFAFVEFQNRNNCLKAIKELNGTSFKGRNIILDESVSKQRYIQSKVNQEEKNEKKEVDENLKENKLNIQAEKEKIEENEQDEQEQKEIEEESEYSEDSDEKQEESKEVQQIKQEKNKQKSDLDQKKDRESEIFIRNLPISVKEEDLHQFFRKYGKIKFAKIVMNKECNISKGTAFVKFQNPAKAKQLIEYSRSFEMNLLGKFPNFKQNPAINLEMQGTILKLFPVESRQNVAEKIKDRDAKDKERQDLKNKKKKPIKKIRNLEKLVQYDPNNKRNLKLALLGLNQVNEDMKEQDVERFKTHEREKIQKLKNPNNSVSDRRIVFKYLKKDITEENIRSVCQDYMKQTQIKPKDLTYCKLMFESLETKKSAGYAFVEFKTQGQSLNFLEWICQSSQKVMKEPFICEFAIQDSRKMIKLQNRNQKKDSKSQSKQKSIKKKK